MSSSSRSHTLGYGPPDATHREFLLLVVAIVFVFANAIAISIVTDSTLDWDHLYPAFAWMALFISIHLVLRRYRPSHDPFLLPIAALLTGWGLVTLDRLAPSILHRQVLWIVFASIALLGASLLPSTLWFFRRYRYSWLILGLTLLAATLLLGVNPSGAGAELWLRVPVPGRVYFQPSELLKLLLIVFLASYFEEREQLLKLDSSGDRAGSLRNLAPLLLMWGFSLVLLIWQRDLGAATLFLIVFLALLYLATGNWRYVLAGISMLVVAGIVAYLVYDVVEIRFNSWFNPWPDARAEGYQIVQSLYALASGNILGQGIGQGFPTYVPVVHTDFAFAAIAEEWGLVGSLVTVVCFALITYRGLRIAALCKNLFRLYLAAGVAVVLGLQSLLIMGGITRLLPLTGVTLPFVSYGGSSLLISGLMIGFLLNLSSQEEGNTSNFSQVIGQTTSGYLPSRATKLRLRYLSTVAILSFAVVSILVIYWTAIRGPSMLNRDDNPRIVEEEKRIKRGRILDANGLVLAETIADSDSISRRRYHPASGPSVGYYSIAHGTDGIENSLDAVLRGAEDGYWRAFWSNDLLHLPQEGRDVRLTIDSIWQERAGDLLEDNKGAVILLSLPDNAIRTLVSQPTFDANSLDDQFETLSEDANGPLLNRVDQGQYQPGLTIQPFFMAKAIDLGTIELSDIAAVFEVPIYVNGRSMRCAGDVAYPLTWSDVLANRCPGEMSQLSDTLDATTLLALYGSPGLNASLENGNLGQASDTATIDDLELAIIGQDKLVVSPLQIGLSIASLANGGMLLPPRIIEAIEDENGGWLPQAGSTDRVELMSEDAARQTLLAMNEADGIIEHSVVVLSGPAGNTNSWYLGLAPAGEPRYVVVVVVEDSDDLHSVEEIGRSILRGALSGETR
jgi:cell division protein FtsW (lipid II flippase)